MLGVGTKTLGARRVKSRVNILSWYNLQALHQEVALTGSTMAKQLTSFCENYYFTYSTVFFLPP